jgi:hypothetical protein
MTRRRPVMTHASDRQTVYAHELPQRSRTDSVGVNAIQSWNPVADAEVMREGGECKRFMHRSGQRFPAGVNYGVTAAAKRMKHMLPEKTGSASQQDARAGSIGS